METKCFNCKNAITEKGIVLSCTLSKAFNNPSLMALGYRGCCHRFKSI